MVEIRSIAVTIGGIRKPGAEGYSDNILMVPYQFAQDRIDEFVISQKLVLEENDALCKEVEKLRYENQRLKKQVNFQQPHVGGVCHC